MKPFSDVTDWFGDWVRGDWGERVRRALWVVLITLLVWAYADMEFTETVELSGSLVVTAEQKKGVVMLSAGLLELPSFEVRGNRAALDRFKRDFNESGAEFVYDVSERYGPGRHLLPVTELIEQNPLVEEYGLTVVSATPTMVEVTLDRLVARESIPVRVPVVGGQLDPKTPMEIQPKTVRIQVAESDLPRLPPDEQLTVRTLPVDLKTLSVGETHTVTAAIVPQIDGVPVRVSVPEVTVTVRVAQQIQQRTFKVTTRLLVPTTWAEQEFWKQYKLVRPDDLSWRQEITVRGAQKDLEQLTAEKIDAYVALTPDDTRPVASWLTREVDIHLPRGLDVELVGDPPTVNFRLVRRDAVDAP